MERGHSVRKPLLAASFFEPPSISFAGDARGADKSVHVRPQTKKYRKLALNYPLENSIYRLNQTIP